MRCPQCGYEIADGSAFCSFCGAQFSAVSAPEPVGVPAQDAYAAPDQSPSSGVDLTNARNGLGNLFISQVIALAASFGTVAIALVTLAIAASSRSASAANSAFGIIGAVGLIAALLVIVAFIIRMVALYQLNKVNERFQMAFYLTIASIVLAVLRQFVGGGGVDTLMAVALAVISDILNLAVLYMLYQGIIDLAKQLGDLVVASTGKSLLTASLVIYVLGIVLTVAAAMLAPSMAAIVSVVGAVALLIPDILLLVMLSKGKKMLAAF